MSVGDFKVIGINDEGTSVKHGGDDLDKIARILNGEELSLTINIDNEWSFNDSKLVLIDTTGNNKITISTSEESADWFITITVLGGNRTPVFTDLTQELTNKDIDGSQNTLSNISYSSLLQITDKDKLPDETPFLDETNIWSA